MNAFFQNLNHRLKSIVTASRIPVWLWITILVLIVIRLLIPIVALESINWALANKLGTYDGYVDGVGVSLYRGAYQLEDLQITKKNSKAPAILSVDEIDLSLAWLNLLRGDLSGDVTIERAVIHLIDSKTTEKKQLGNDEPGWQDALNVLIPITIESLKVHNSELYFNNKDLIKDKPVKLSKIEFTATELRTRAHNPSEALSPFTLSTVLQEHSHIKADGKVDILAKSPRADINFSMLKFHPDTVNQMLLTYLPIDLTKGELSIYGEAAMSHESLKGYANIFMKDVEVIAPQQKFLSVKHFFIEIIGAFGNWLLENNKTKMVAAHIPFSRDHGKFDIGTSEAFWSAIKNKTEELKPGFENSISLAAIEGHLSPKELAAEKAEEQEKAQEKK